MSHVLRCPNPSCGTERERTALGLKRSDTLVVSHDADEPQWDDRQGCWAVRCGSCGEVREWRGRVARELARAA